MKTSFIPVLIILSGALLCAQTKVQQHPKPQPAPQNGQAIPQKDELTSAREATDRFLAGLKIAELPEGKQLMFDNQWITGEADHGQHFYGRPQFTEASTLFEKIFDTDVPGVHGYKRLLDMKAVSKAGTQLLTHYWMVAFKDRRTNSWKVLGTEADSTDFDEQIAGFAHTRPDDSEQERYGSYGHWLLLAGRIGEARTALTTGMGASTVVTYGTAESQQESIDLNRLQMKTLLGVIDAIVGK